MNTRRWVWQRRADGRRGFSGTRRLVVLCGLILGVGMLSTAAFAYWAASVNAGGYGSSQAATVNQGATPSAAMTAAQQVTVSWAATTLSNGQAVDGYIVKRYDTNSNLQTILASCTGTINADTCIETSVPYGAWKYTVTPVLGTNWQGAESSQSGTVTVGASTLTLAKSIFGAPFPQDTTGTLVGFIPSEGLSYRLDGGTAMTGSPSSVNGSGNATINPLTIPSTTDGPHTVYAIGNNVPVASQASTGIVTDATAPTVSAQLTPAANGPGWNSVSPVSVALTGSDGVSGSGIDFIKYTTDGTNPTSSGTAVVYSTPISVAATTTLKFYARDLAGNASGVSTQVVSIDTVAPTNSLALSNVTGNALKTGNTVYYRGTPGGSFTVTNTVTDGGSGPASSGTAALTGTSTGWTHSSSSVSTPAGGPYVSNTFTWSSGTTTSPNETVTGADVAGNTTGTTLSYVNDIAGPSGGAVDPTGLVGTGSRYSTSTTLSVAFTPGTDAGVGIAATGRKLKRATATLTNGTCGSYGAYSQVGADDPTSPKSDTVADQACYSYQYLVADTLGNSTTYTSGDVKVDTTAPSAPTLSYSALTNTYASGNTVYYRSGASSGSFIATGSSTDAASGILSYTFGSAGSSWSSNLSGADNTYSWASSNPTTNASASVTGRNNANTSGSGTTITLTADGTAPSTGSVTYNDGYVSANVVSVAFASGTDGGSGLAPTSGVLQRASATLTSGSCGSYGAWGTVASNTASPYIDTGIANGYCYQYQYLFSDRVGNQATYTSANVVKVDYANAVNNTAGLVGQWRLGEATTTLDTFSGATGGLLSAHTDDSGNGWTQHLVATTAVVSNQNRIRSDVGGTTMYRNNVVPPASGNYTVEGDFRVKSLLANGGAGLMSNIDLTNSNGIGTNFVFRYDIQNGSWRLSKNVNNVGTSLGTDVVTALSVNQTYHVELDVTTTKIRGVVDGVEIVSAANDGTVPAGGRAGVRFYNTGSDTTNIHIDNFRVTPSLADSKGSNIGRYEYGPTLGVTGALSGDSNTAASLNGSTTYGSVPDANALDLGDTFTLEAWAKRADNGTSMQNLLNKGAGGYQIGFYNNKFCLYVSYAGEVAATTATQLDTTAFHHYVATKNGSAVHLYVDGVDLTGPVTNYTSGNTGDALTIGSEYNGVQVFNGRIDEAAVYNTALTGAVVDDHYNLGHGSDASGPADGTVDATGLVGTGSRYSTSTSLSVAFTPGSDTAGMAATGRQLKRATATLTNGTCGSYGAYAQVGANDLASPRAETVTDQACYSYHYVVSDALGNTTTYASGDVKVDTTAPSTPTAAYSALTNAYVSGSTVYYNSTGTGSFTSTASSTDTASGVASYSFPTLGSGWTSTPGALGVNTYSWTATPTAPGAKTITATNNAAATSATYTFTPTADATAPSGGSLISTNGYLSGPSVSITLPSATDGGSGLNSAGAVLQRATATYTAAGGCGSYGAYATIATAPASPYTDTGVANERCYTYQYLISDNVGNQATYTSTSIAKADYANAVNATTGAVSQWRLGDATTATATDSFTGAAGALTGHTGETGATWTHQAGTGNETLTNANRIRHTSNTYSIDYASGVPASADYSVSADLYVQSNLSDDWVGVAGRMNTGSNTFYMARYEQTDTSWNLIKYNNGTLSYINYSTGNTLTVGQTYHITLTMAGSSLSVLVNGVVKASGTDSSYSAAGRVGIMDGDPSKTVTKSDSTGYHLDNFSVSGTAAVLADSKGANTGTYLNSPTLGATGAVVNDSDSAVTLNGTNEYGQVASPTGLPVGATARSAELWFKTSSNSKQAFFSYGSKSTRQMFGVKLETDGTLMFWGYGGDLSWTPGSSVRNGAWHHLALTYNGASSLTMYVDGTSLGAQSLGGALNTVVDGSYGLGIGANLATGDSNSGLYFNGSIDDVSIYTGALSATTVSNHYHLGSGVGPAADGSGPVGGTVDASSLVGTGSRYSTSTSLSVAFTPGSDTAGMGSGFQLQRATATLTNGTCGSYGAYAQVGANDLASPRAETVTDQACYSYHYVVSDALGNTTTYASGDVKVDTTAPSTPTAAYSALTNAYVSGSTVYYNSTGTGSFTSTASSTDTASGVASYSFPTLGSGWTSTPGALGVNTYSWTATPTAPGAKTITATNNAAATSATYTFTPTADATAPSGGSLTYTDGLYGTLSVAVTLATGTDAGSGLAAPLLQRASATYTSGTCNTYSAFATIATSPASPYTDTSVTNGYCYKYQYVVADNVSNSTTYTSANVAKFDYAASVLGTTGLVSQWRMTNAATTYSADTFTAAAGTTLQSHTADSGSTWTRFGGSTANLVTTPGNRLRLSASGGGQYYNSAVPPSANYAVEADVYVASLPANHWGTIMGRWDTTNSNGTYYYTEADTNSSNWTLFSNVNGSPTILATASATLTVGQTYRLKLDMNGTAIKVYVNGTLKISVTNNAISAAGKGGVQVWQNGGTVSDAAGLQMTNWDMVPNATTVMTDAKGTNNGTFANSPGFLSPGAIAGDSDTAVAFNGSSQYGQVTTPSSLPTGAGARTVEMWFKTSSASKQALFSYGTLSNGRMFGMILSNSTTLTAWHYGTGYDKDITTPSMSDGAWHHLAVTYNGTTETVYLDGSSVSTQTVALNTLVGATGFGVGRNIMAGDANSDLYFNGSVDDVAVYSVALSGPTISDHYHVGHGS